MNKLLNLQWWTDPIKRKEVSEKISIRLKGRPAAWVSGKKRNEICQKISLAKTGRKFSVSLRKKLSMANLKSGITTQGYVRMVVIKNNTPIIRGVEHRFIVEKALGENF